MAWRVGLGVSAAIVLVAVILAVLRVGWRADREVQVATMHVLRERGGAEAPLARAHLFAEQRVAFELCADDPLEAERWSGALTLAIHRARGHALVYEAPLDSEMLSAALRSETHACLLFGQGLIEHEDDYTVEVRYQGEPPEVTRGVRATTRIQSRDDLTGVDLGAVALLWLGTLGLVGFLLLRRPGIPTPDADAALWEEAVQEADADEGPRPPRRAWPPEARVGLGVALVLGAFIGSGWLPPGAAFGLSVGVILALFEIGVGLGLADARGLVARLELLSLARPRRAVLWIPGAILAGVLLVQIALLTTQIVPSTSQSVIQTYVSWPSGLLSFAALAVFAPLAEEVFFRGFVYGVLARRSAVLAFFGAWLLFVVAHLPQTFGQWGALVGILVTGLALTALRAASGSTLVAALAHLVYNGLLALSGVLPTE